MADPARWLVHEDTTVRCTRPGCFDEQGIERSRFTREQVAAFDFVQLGRVEVLLCATFPGTFHTRARRRVGR